MQNTLQFTNTNQSYIFGMVQSLLFIKQTNFQALELDLALQGNSLYFNFKKNELKKCEKLKKRSDRLIDVHTRTYRSIFRAKLDENNC